MREYHYTECGLDNIYLVNGFEITKNRSDKEIFIHDIHGLHKMIGMSLISKQGFLTGDEVRFIRTTLDLSQTILAKMLGCTYQTILLWEKNRVTITPASDRLLRILFYEYLNPRKNRKIYDLVNEIADLEASQIANDATTKILFEVAADAWHVAA